MSDLVESVKSVGGLTISIHQDDLIHTWEKHPEVSLNMITECLRNPGLIIESRWSRLSCLYYKLESLGQYLCVVVEVIGSGYGRLRTAYRTNYIKKGLVLYESKVF